MIGVDESEEVHHVVLGRDGIVNGLLFPMTKSSVVFWAWLWSDSPWRSWRLANCSPETRFLKWKLVERMTKKQKR
jgi:hypothetical protein